MMFQLCPFSFSRLHLVGLVILSGLMSLSRIFSPAEGAQSWTAAGRWWNWPDNFPPISQVSSSIIRLKPRLPALVGVICFQVKETSESGPCIYFFFFFYLHTNRGAPLQFFSQGKSETRSGNILTQTQMSSFHASFFFPLNGLST